MRTTLLVAAVLIACASAAYATNFKHLVWSAGPGRPAQAAAAAPSGAMDWGDNWGGDWQ